MHFGELFEVFRQRAGDGVKRAIRLTPAGEINAGDAVGIFDFAVAGEAVEHQGQALVAFHVAGTFKEFIEHRADQVPG